MFNHLRPFDLPITHKKLVTYSAIANELKSEQTDDNTAMWAAHHIYLEVEKKPGKPDLRSIQYAAHIEKFKSWEINPKNSQENIITLTAQLIENLCDSGIPMVAAEKIAQITIFRLKIYGLAIEMTRDFNFEIVDSLIKYTTLYVFGLLPEFRNDIS